MKKEVALESTVIAHGLPKGINFETALNMERAVRENGGTPRTIGILGGEIVVGLTNEQIKKLGMASNVLKVGTAEIAYATAMKRDAATTVSATMAISRTSGISVFATGGIGGVHRGIDWDVSQDIIELSRTRMIVVSAGVKSILDVPKTLEFLETFGVTVVGYRTDCFPLFHCSKSPYRINLTINSPEEAVQILKEKERLGIEGGVLVANPIPESDSMNFDELSTLIESALKSAETNGVSGKALTPYLLSRLAELSDGKTLDANISLLINNASLGGLIAASFGAEK
ncbi:pseudouridine-5'-phosphate glycosidase [Mesotoga sp.]|uniref:Pseudouridine-5'-phosphate glycosidase n=1 Tax=Mesotoga infera TaxID=1236046 RepID=A0A101I9W1_9BACT|nr:MAG: Pseudouridine-5'-phosphate glycosidase [Mesotoga infera]KUK91323.1 MAG: Pseudouridine-5'-phosphate glycosidase [Mesotoga infera]HCO70155.1 pseudouridine-5-phosphate glycosidase [Mesotoga infera]